MAGFPIWYELMSTDRAGSADFYREVFGWTVPPQGDVMPNGSEYAMIMHPDGSPVGGVLKLTEQMCEQGARPCWITYFEVDDVDAAVERITGAGGLALMPPVSMEVGRMAMVADPQGAPFYVMAPNPPEGAPDSASGVYAPEVVGRCSWNELNTSAAADQIEFYTSLFDWQVAGEMPMPGDHIYKFLNHGDTGVGAIGSMKPEGMPSAWLPYFRVADIDKAKAAAGAAGGTLMHGPHQVPNDDHIIVVTDPAGATLGIVGKKLS